MSDRFETQERLIAATRAVMVSHGIEGCTLERICSVAGYSRGAFYSNFGNKEDLFTLVAQDEYDTTIRRLNRVAERWESELLAEHNQLERGENYLDKMTDLLSKVLAELKLDREYFIIHNEMLVRAARVPAWGIQFRHINQEFVDSMAHVLQQILHVVDRKMVQRPEAVAQAVIGVVLRATGYDVWRQQGEDRPSAENRPDLPTSEEINQMIVMLLAACSAPLNPNQNV
ncbi:TetR/AcrR family transcriptional regulator [Boudabousia marimammalium]|uniref:HTH tetR-type domain-containing protein n=1 Tax=Boudabousia marimammalium TaxID=156892 RepID=A0A1Q5PP24_9ACTO|nr:TetR/AcrR family transcriptional regulator [Boudabousia marimammalium]OKL49277.1 hypothetical protein BM477_04645 [Boudabousia marimammalium]